MTDDTVKFVQEDVEGGGRKEDVDDLESDFAYRNNVLNASITIRLGFLRKVYGLLSVQLLLTFVIATIFMVVEPVKIFAQQNPWMFPASFLVTIVTLIALYVKRREHPINLMLLTLFTLTQGYTIGTIVSMFDVATVLEALCITLTVTLGLTIYAFQSKRDLSMTASGLFIGLWILLFGGLLQIFLQNTILEFVLGIGGALLMSMFIVFDTHMIMDTLSPEEYVLATINIYLDIINLFLYILRILAISKQ